MEMHWELLRCSSETHAWTFHADFVHCDHHGADEFISALETEEFVLPVGFVEEDNVQSDGMSLEDSSEFCKDVLLVLAVFRTYEFEEAVAESVDLFNGGTEFDSYWYSFSKAT